MKQPVEDRCKNFDTIDIPSISITLKTDFLSREFLLLLYKFSGETLSYNITLAVELVICEEDSVDHMDEHIHACFL